MVSLLPRTSLEASCGMSAFSLAIKTEKERVSAHGDDFVHCLLTAFGVCCLIFLVFFWPERDHIISIQLSRSLGSTVFLSAQEDEMVLGRIKPSTVQKQKKRKQCQPHNVIFHFLVAA